MAEPSATLYIHTQWNRPLARSLKPEPKKARTRVQARSQPRRPGESLQVVVGWKRARHEPRGFFVQDMHAHAGLVRSHGGPAVRLFRRANRASLGPSWLKLSPEVATQALPRNHPPCSVAGCPPLTNSGHATLQFPVSRSGPCLLVDEISSHATAASAAGGTRFACFFNDR